MKIDKKAAIDVLPYVVGVVTMIAVSVLARHVFGHLHGWMASR
jgi:hypothetical protein